MPDEGQTPPSSVAYLGPLRVPCGACHARIGEQCGLTPKEKEFLDKHPERVEDLRLDLGDYHGSRYSALGLLPPPKIAPLVIVPGRSDQ